MCSIETDDSGFHEVPRTPSLHLSSKKRRSDGSSVDGQVPDTSSNGDSTPSRPNSDSNEQGVPFTPTTSDMSFRIAFPSIDHSVPQQAPEVGRLNKMVRTNSMSRLNLSNANRRHVKAISSPRIATSERFAEQADWINTFAILPQPTCRGGGDADNTNEVLFNDDDAIFADSFNDGNSACHLLNDPNDLPCTSRAHVNSFSRSQYASKDISLGTTSAEKYVHTFWIDNEDRVRSTAATEERTRRMAFIWNLRCEDGSSGNADNKRKQVFDDDNDIFG